MKITLFTSNKQRHNCLINLLSNTCDELYVIQECGTIFPGLIPDHYPQSKVMQKYFNRVANAQSKIFNDKYINNSNKNIKLLPVIFGDLNNCELNFISDFLKSDLYIVFGCSYIKGNLIEFLVKNKAINIHMGVSPYYRGTDCNFWALYDNNPHLVGATIHHLGKGLDSGPILYHAMSQVKSDPFEYSMLTVKSAFNSLVERINNRSIFKIEPDHQNNINQIRYSKKIDFNDNVINNFLSKNIDLHSKNFDLKMLKEPYFLK